MGLCMNLMLIYLMLSVIRCLVCHEVVWFADLDENIVALFVNITSVVLSIIHRFVVHFFKGIIVRFSFLSGDSYLCDTDSSTRAPVGLYIILTTSLLFELYIGIKIKKMSCTRFISVTFGHLYMTAGAYILLNFKDSSTAYMHALSVIISFQLLYVLKQKEYTIELLKKYCKVPNNTVDLFNENIELNDFGIFVGPQVRTEPIFIIESSIRNPNMYDDAHGGVYMG